MKSSVAASKLNTGAVAEVLMKTGAGDIATGSYGAPPSILIERPIESWPSVHKSQVLQIFPSKALL